MSQGIGSVLGGPVAAAIHDSAGSWTPVFMLAVGMDVLTGLLALFVLKKMRAGFLTAQSEEPVAPLVAAAA
jgi:cyanate permease